MSGSSASVSASNPENSRARFAFVEPDDPSAPDIFIREAALHGALHGDRVEVALDPSVPSERPAGEVVRIVSRRGAIEAPVRYDPILRPGLTFMTFHFQDDIATNIITIDATDPKSGTAEFKAAAIRIEKLNGSPAGRPLGKVEIAADGGGES